ncbi:MAG: Na(+)-translocating NADH-quinone reductase subunit A [Candidatus Hydrogenedentes bacterium ADurb.Bin101]|mgnify:CR=1 FL=1|jgi:Na+-transporting NADH:ubiquinone oxidoreductase subunit A|nr:MAG: Na(+)-translocating NADH-quinone reductase subunit A [Candidatus Hydrogenedentes bacterium ADurb.Bin101]HOC67851.1 NADH:ubiquinone reductase (Na(+)-transporting) subunit A [Candidatus Hydrogenedentota bacterium]
MGNHQIRKGLNLPIAGEPQQVVSPKQANCVAVMALDHVGLKPRMLVQPGDVVKRGQALFEDKKAAGALFTAPGAGTVRAVHRGERRALQSVVIDLTESEASGSPTAEDFQLFSAYTGSPVDSLSREQVRDLLVESGLWVSLRTRPLSHVPHPEGVPNSIFITACDSNPLAPDMDALVDGRQAALDAGVLAMTKLTPGTIFFCKSAKDKLAPTVSAPNLQVETFSGPHPSGTVGVHIHTLDPIGLRITERRPRWDHLGLHIHLLDPVGGAKTVWHIGLQDLLSVGELFLTGKLDVTRIISLGGPMVKKPRLLRTRLGASIGELVAGELEDGENRIISGSVFNGRQAAGEVLGYLGRFHNQICVLREGREREFMGWLAPGGNKFSISRLFLSKLTPSKLFGMHTGTHGSPRAIVPIGLYEQVMPMDIQPTYLLRSLCVDDVEQAEKLGCLELDEEDLALCSFVDPGKTDFGPILRRNLELIEKEG